MGTPGRFKGRLAGQIGRADEDIGPYGTTFSPKIDFHGRQRGETPYRIYRAAA